MLTLMTAWTHALFSQLQSLSLSFDNSSALLCQPDVHPLIPPRFYRFPEASFHHFCLDRSPRLTYLFERSTSVVALFSVLVEKGNLRSVKSQQGHGLYMSC